MTQDEFRDVEAVAHETRQTHENWAAIVIGSEDTGIVAVKFPWGPGLVTICHQTRKYLSRNARHLLQLFRGSDFGVRISFGPSGFELRTLSKLLGINTLPK
jgi:hypothetical protein